MTLSQKQRVSHQGICPGYLFDPGQQKRGKKNIKKGVMFFSLAIILFPILTRNATNI